MTNKESWVNGWNGRFGHGMGIRVFKVFSIV